MKKADIPHLQMPFNVVAGAVQVVDQDSIEDVAGCVEVILRTPRGIREELPEFGTQNPTFTAPLDLERLRRAVAEWEPRTEVSFEENMDAFDLGLRRVRATIAKGGS